MINPFHIKQSARNFRERHHDFVSHTGQAAEQIQKGSVIQISITHPDGKKTISDFQVNEEDYAFYLELKKIFDS